MSCVISGSAALTHPHSEAHANRTLPCTAHRRARALMRARPQRCRSGNAWAGYKDKGCAVRIEGPRWRTCTFRQCSAAGAPPAERPSRSLRHRAMDPLEHGSGKGGKRRAERCTLRLQWQQWRRWGRTRGLLLAGALPSVAPHMSLADTGARSAGVGISGVLQPLQHVDAPVRPIRVAVAHPVGAVGRAVAGPTVL